MCACPGHVGLLVRVGRLLPLSRIVASYRRRMGVVAVREMARHRIRQSAYVGLTRQQLDDIMQERERQRDRLEAAAAAADRSVEIAQSYVVPAFERGA